MRVYETHVTKTKSLSSVGALSERRLRSSMPSSGMVMVGDGIEWNLHVLPSRKVKARNVKRTLIQHRQEAIAVGGRLLDPILQGRMNARLGNSIPKWLQREQGAL
jgi:hypothetical protein